MSLVILTDLWRNSSNVNERNFRGRGLNSERWYMLLDLNMFHNRSYCNMTQTYLKRQVSEMAKSHLLKYWNILKPIANVDNN